MWSVPLPREGSWGWSWKEAPGMESPLELAVEGNSAALWSERFDGAGRGDYAVAKRRRRMSDEMRVRIEYCNS